MLTVMVTVSDFGIIHANEDDNGGGQSVYVIPIEKEVERGLEAFLSRTTEEAVEEGADHIIFEINTPGGRVDAAGNIASDLQSLEIPTTSFVVNQALYDGYYFALYNDNIYKNQLAIMYSSVIIYI